MTFSLDTNAVIAVLRDPGGTVAQRLRQRSPGDVSVSAVVLHELYWGAYRSARVEHNLAQVDALAFPVLDLDLDDAREAGQLRAELAAVGLPIGGYDLLIAGQARARGLIVVTANTREFERVSGLSVEDWAAA
ncbi:type II toxin-antitoxin system VapC family toxin [Sphingomonas bacterium]|uniref:type II toxin-antitoxin system VapC family toxin n=1 Tax=Sphingomonas bacterium TaxID=1895847 RepID=UPI00157616C1|nr:type II toxin-antitoxin system VapC family toxin [Sphingomonas bacterium]